MKTTSLRKAIVPVAGYGTRFLPVTKAIPKEMLPLVDKPVVQYVVEQLSQVGIETVIFITGWHKRAVEDHFDRHLELEQKLKEAGKIELLKQIQKISELANFVFIRQKEARGNGDAILTAEPVIEEEPFVVMWGDEIIEAKPPVLEQLKFWFKKLRSSVLTVLPRKDKEAGFRYAFVRGKDKGEYIEVEEIIEKPGENPPSEWAVFSPFIFTPSLLRALKTIKKPKGEELVYVDGLRQMIQEGEKVYAVKIKNATYHDCGNLVEYLKTIILLALRRKELKELKTFLRSLLEK
ncbi:NTP transferase domain-containing protein [bacterium]|nr:NTP transferase domain-containing protein [bacterium]